MFRLMGLALLILAVSAPARVFPFRAESNAAQRGERAARKAGCFSCHGPGGVGGVANPGAAAGTVPGFDGPTMALYVKRDADLKNWVLRGKAGTPRVSTAAARGVIRMPSYEGFLSSQELGDIVAYLRAVSGRSPENAAEVPDKAYEGRRVAVRFGCLGCHGPSGTGGVSNVGSFKGYIPSFDGEDFAELVRGEDELREWILEGRIARLWGNLIARRFLKRQRIQMPAYRGHLSEDQLKKLIAYIRWLRRG